MSTLKKLALIAAGYFLAIVVGIAAVAVNELRMPADVAQGSPGMVAFGDVILFVFATGFSSLVPTWFLLRLFVEKAPRTLLAIVLLLAVMGPVSWLAVTAMALTAAPGGPSLLPKLPVIVGELLGLFIAFAAIPRMVLGPVLVVIEGVTMLLLRQRSARVLLGAAMLMDIVPVSLFALHMARAVRY
jgi:hypothetical protein